MSPQTREITVESTLDGSKEPSLLFAPKSGKKPLLVWLHSWSADRMNNSAEVSAIAGKLGMSALFPEFRGPNLASNPRAAQACASALAVRDITDAVEKLVKEDAANPEEIFLAGGSGGAHAALMAAAYRPRLWKAVIASCPITDLAGWHAENINYSTHIEACCGGPPSPKNEEYRKRSPLFHAGTIARARVYIMHGKNDASVPYTHSLRLFNEISGLRKEAEVYLEVFRGGHESRLDRLSEIITKLSGPEKAVSQIPG